MRECGSAGVNEGGDVNKSSNQKSPARHQTRSPQKKQQSFDLNGGELLSDYSHSPTLSSRNGALPWFSGCWARQIHIKRVCQEITPS